MKTNHQMNYYDYGKNLDIQGVMPVIRGGGHEYVDLGLSVKWATCNIGANSPEEAGLYFAWGETSGYTAEQVGDGEGKRIFYDFDYKFGPYSAVTKYNGTDGLTVLEPEDDAATVNWGEEWRIPTKAEFEELMALPHTWDSSRSGYSITDANDNELLFLFAGGTAFWAGVREACNQGFYWSASLFEDDDYSACNLNFSSNEFDIRFFNRFVGNTVRPVHK